MDNWWGTSVEQEIKKTIFDKKNDPRLGEVTFKPYRTSQENANLKGIGNAAGLAASGGAEK